MHFRWQSGRWRFELLVLAWRRAVGLAFAIAFSFPSSAASETRAELTIRLREMMSFGQDLPGVERQFTATHVDQCKLVVVLENLDDVCLPAKILRSELEIDLNSVGDVTQLEFNGMFAVSIYPRTWTEKNVAQSPVKAVERFQYCDGRVAPGTVSEVVTLFVPIEGRQELSKSITQYIKTYCSG